MCNNYLIRLFSNKEVLEADKWLIYEIMSATNIAMATGLIIYDFVSVATVFVNG